jgi:hypothetical protein
MVATFRVGPLTITETGERRPLEAETTKKHDRAGAIARIFDVTGPDVDAEIADVRFVNNKRDVRMLSRRATEPLDRLVRGLRVGVHTYAERRWFVELRIPSTGSRKTVTQHQTHVAELNRVCQLDVPALLVDLGATAVNRRELAIGDHSRRANELCAAFAEQDSIVPVVAYTITPLLAYWYLHCDGRHVLER